MPGKDLGSRTALGVSDANYKVNPYLLATGWDVIFAPELIASNETVMEVYHIALDGPVGSSLKVMRDNRAWGYVAQGWANEWDPSQPLFLSQTNTLQFCWNVAFVAGPYNKTTNVQPEITIWLRQSQPVIA